MRRDRQERENRGWGRLDRTERKGEEEKKRR